MGGAGWGGEGIWGGEDISACAQHPHSAPLPFLCRVVTHLLVRSSWDCNFPSTTCPVRDGAHAHRALGSHTPPFPRRIPHASLMNNIINGAISLFLNAF